MKLTYIVQTQPFNCRLSRTIQVNR